MARRTLALARLPDSSPSEEEPMAKMILSRRAVLRGALAGGGLATLPLPRLAAMLNGNGTAYAAGEPLRRVYGTWFWANGVHADPLDARAAPAPTSRSASS